MNETNYYTALINKVSDLTTKVYDVLKAGYDETVYEEALLVEFRKFKLPFEKDKKIEVIYDGHKVGDHGLDFIIDNALALELKAKSVISGNDITQLHNFMRHHDLIAGMVINFQSPYNAAGPDSYIVSDKNSIKQ